MALFGLKTSFLVSKCLKISKKQSKIDFLFFYDILNIYEKSKMFLIIINLLLLYSYSFINSKFGFQELFL